MTLSDDNSTTSNFHLPIPICDSATFRTREVLGAPLTLQEAADDIVRLAKEADDRTLLAAQKLVALKKRIINGEAGPDVKWMEWLLRNVKLSSSQLYFLVSIGEAHRPAQALEDYRRMKREKAKADREAEREGKREPRAPTAYTPERKLLLKVMRSIPEAEVPEMLSICRATYPTLFEEQRTTH